MAKDKLSGGKNGKQYTVDLGTPQRRLYLGHDYGEALRRKDRLQELWRLLMNEGWAQWDDFAVVVADAIRQGKTTVTVDPQGAPTDFHYRLRIDDLDDLNKRFAGLVTFIATDQRAYECLEDLRDKYRQVKEAVAAQGKGGGSDTQVAETLDAYKAHNLATKLDPATKRPTEWGIKIGGMCDFIQRQLPPNVTLRHFDYPALERLCLDIANRPTSKRGGRPVSPKYSGACLKIVRNWVKWTSKN